MLMALLVLVGLQTLLVVVLLVLFRKVDEARDRLQGKLDRVLLELASAHSHLADLHARLERPEPEDAPAQPKAKKRKRLKGG